MKANLITVGVNNSDTLSIKEIDQHHFSTPFHFHKICELNHVVSSSGKRIVGDNINNFSDGDLVLMSPDLPHIWHNDPAVLNVHEDKKLAKAIVVYFPLDFLEKLTSDDDLLLRKKRLMDKAQRGLRFYGKTQQKVSARLHDIIEQKGMDRIVTFLEIMELLINSKECEQLASVGYTHRFNEKDTERMNNVIQHLMQHFTEPVRLEEIAAIASMTPPAFSSFFKKRTQKNFTLFLNEIRIGHACKLLENLEMTISDVCFSSGFQNFTHFNKCFRQFTGKTPREYRKLFYSFSE
jgi:AraC-like DNA-binding protein